MKVRWKGKTEFLVLTHDKAYTAFSMEKGWYRLVDDSGEDYLYPPENFEVMEGWYFITIQELKDHPTNLVGHVTFIYNGFFCSIDPLAKNLFEVWCGDDVFSVSFVNEVLNDELFDGRPLTDIWGDVTDLDF